LFKVKENKGLCGDVLEYVAQTRPPIDAEIGQKDHFRMETRMPSGLIDPVVPGGRFEEAYTVSGVHTFTGRRFFDVYPRR
jgi:hypothetical protein